MFLGKAPCTYCEDNETCTRVVVDGTVLPLCVDGEMEQWGTTPHVTDMVKKI